MRNAFITLLLLLILPISVSAAGKNQKLYRWIDSEGLVHYGDSIPAEYAELERQIVNEHGITVDVLRAKMTAEEIAEEKHQDDLRMQRELERRADQALLATYLTIDEILMHRDRRIELFEAQARVTELYLRNLERRMSVLKDEASGFQPYSEDPDAEMISTDLANDIASTKQTITRHEANLQRFQNDQQGIVARFDGDINRFKKLKGLN
ncbi:MAG: hypothetical protein DRR11_10245 [Gammaproteobacteria bacterium]|nr:MAG: hypothetical protein DRR11_10245 [Gammaproteobacteria bacterium]RLA35772.1 MAG: hypothetical protein DRR15_06635 [Gammaproteobacteria bacterium]